MFFMICIEVIYKILDCLWKYLYGREYNKVISGFLVCFIDRKFAKTAKSDYDEWMKFKEDFIERNKN